MQVEGHGHEGGVPGIDERLGVEVGRRASDAQVATQSMDGEAIVYDLAAGGRSRQLLMR